ncbi:ABC transporter substrate-binding protein [Plantactinospora soyae]|uniref:Branched-chain amino acid transport system substrate-binding protein n=1 Tax=Plantactinospora soyae TaxID=1544732 RepID=A0A927LZ08_9ACTN|nr:ABC transporter substrate-binding protein [Plantactinospora soyae]MBE1485107.1 branched-chain amino acid transport system substrate-binding protein [Plantactinospora soyae]
MRPIRSAIPALLASAILATSLTGCQFGAPEQEGGEILIGADLELSGAAAQVGKAYQRALELKVEQLNESGALGNRTVKLDVRDNRFDPSVSAGNIGDFTSNPAISGIIMGSCNECAISAAKTVNDKRVPAIALAPAGDVSSPAVDRRYMFKLGPNARDNVAAIVAELASRKVESVGLLHTDDSYGREGLALLKFELGQARIDLLPERSVKATDTDVSQSVRTLVDEEPEALIVWAPAEQATLASASLAEERYKGHVFFDAVAAGELFVGGGNRAENTTMVFTQTMVIDDVIATTPAKAARKQWFRDYTARFGGYYGYSSFAADAIQLIVDAAARAEGNSETPNRDSIRSLLETAETDGLSGPIRMTPENHSGLMPQALTLLVARGGRWRLAN